MSSPRTVGEERRDANVVALLRRIADALDAIAGTLAAVYDMEREGRAPARPEGAEDEP